MTCNRSDEKKEELNLVRNSVSQSQTFRGGPLNIGKKNCIKALLSNKQFVVNFV